MEAIVGGAFLTASVEKLMEIITSGEFIDFFRRAKLDDVLIYKVKTTLLRLQYELRKGGDKQFTDDLVAEWRNTLQDVVYEAEDLFDEINTEALRCNVEANQVLKKCLSYFKKFNKEINSKLLKLYEKLDYLKIQNPVLKDGDSSFVRNTTPTSPVLGNEYEIKGREDDKMNLINRLLSDDGCDSEHKIEVISIVGMGGLGKTTLASLLYNDHHVKEKFKVRGWVHIPKVFDVVIVTKTILESVTSGLGTNTETNLSKLQKELQQTLSNQKFLLVLDDMLHENYVGWNSLSDIFNGGKIGSKIIITTRDKRVALPKQRIPNPYELGCLKDEESWSLLAINAFGQRNYQQHSEHPTLEKIGIKIAKKCGGLPLAVLTLGGILRTKLSHGHWSDVLKSSIWEQTNDVVQPSLLLSYHFLPDYLKGCFAYCSIFPKNSILSKKTVVQLWIAEGLVPQPKSEKSWEKVAEEYFVELVSRSLIRQRSIDDESEDFLGDEKEFEMHDLINDLAMKISSPYCTRLDNHKTDEMIDKRVRHLSFDRIEYYSYNKFENLHGLKGLRTFLPMPLQISWNYGNSMPLNLCSGLLSTMTQLHVLSLSHFKNITELPNFIGNLIYLRYLNLSSTQIKTLPSETCKLYNLQTLLLSRCKELTELPKDMGKLVKLRHLDIRGTKLKKMPAQISKLKNLHTLSDFVVSNAKDVGLKIEDLGKYPHLRGSLSISQLENVIDPYHASQANLEMKKEIDELELGWSCIPPSNSQIQNVVLERLCPSTNLKSLTISGYGGDKLPDWLDNPLFSNIVCMRISGCKNCSRLPFLGQLSNLKKLFISGMQLIKSVDTMFYGSGSSSFQPFTFLETLSFEDMPKWEEWKLIGDTSSKFPRLKRLSLEKCPKLKENIPINLPELTHLCVKDCHELIGITPNNLPKLSHLCMKHCRKLIGITPNNLPSLVDLTLEDCPSLMESRYSDGTSPSFDIFSQLMISLNSLQKMTLKNIPTLISFPREGLPKTLRSLGIEGCENLKFLSPDSVHSYTSLEDLKIEDSCNSMTSFTLCSLPVLKSLEICKCKHLKSIIFEEDASKQNLLSLKTIYIYFCDELESVSLIGLSIPNLTSLYVIGCKKLGSLPKTLTSLQKMNIQDLPNLQSCSIDNFPISLRELQIGSVGGILWNTTWEHWTSLSELYLVGDDIVKGMMKTQVLFLPTNLVSLVISELEDIECLDGKWLQHLTSLHKLEIYFSPKLKSLPEKGDLPSSLKELRIYKCPLLEVKLRRKKGKEWHKISHIPKICLTNEIIK